MGGPGSGEDPRDAIARLEGHRDSSRNLSHGAYASGTALAQRCHKNCPLRDECEHVTDGRCPVEAQWIADRFREVRQVVEEDGGDLRAAAGQIEVYVDAWLRVSRIRRALAMTGDLLPGVEDGYAEAQPALKLLPQFYRAMESAADKLNLTPKARRSLDPQGGPSLGALLRAAQEAEAIDADFDAEDEESDRDED
jgi:hypothetical protein